MDAWRAALGVLKTLNDAGFEAYMVGGAVRDRLLGHPVKDIDLTTSATPLEVAALFPLAKETNKALGTMMVFVDAFHFEVTTFRQEGDYHKHRRPHQVRFTKNLMHDLVRRDFTINAMLINAQDELLDPLGAEDDLRQGILKAIGDPMVRFEEDALRILRAFRFIAKLNVRLEEATSKALYEKAPTLSHIAIERIQDEWTGLLEAPYAKAAIESLYDTGVYLRYHPLKDAVLTLNELQSIPPLDEALALCYPKTRFDEAPWRFSKQRIKRIKTLTSWFETRQRYGYIPPLLFELGETGIEALERMAVAKRLTPMLEDALVRYKQLPLHTKRALALKGTDLNQLKDVPPAHYQRLLDEALNAVLYGQCPNDKNALLTFVSTRRKETKHA